MKLQTLNDAIVKMYNEALVYEYKAHYAYQYFSNWAENEGFLIASSFWKNESDDELSHARIIQKGLTDWNIAPKLPQIETPKYEINNLADTIMLSYDLEYELYEYYEEISNKILKMGDTCEFDFIQQFRKIQRDSVAEMATKRNKLKGIIASDKFQMLTIEKTYLNNKYGYSLHLYL